MLIALGGVIAGYDGSFSFEKIGIEFPDSVPYVSIRLVSCFFRYYYFYVEKMSALKLHQKGNCGL